MVALGGDETFNRANGWAVPPDMPSTPFPPSLPCPAITRAEGRPVLRRALSTATDTPMLIPFYEKPAHAAALLIEK